MLRPLDVLQQVADVVEADTWLEGSEIAGLNDEGRWRGPIGDTSQPEAERFVDHVPE